MKTSSSIKNSIEEDALLMILIFNSIFLVAANLYLAVFVANKINIRKRLYTFIGKLDGFYEDKRLAREIKKQRMSLTFNMSTMEKIELILIEKSNIRHYIPVMNIQILGILMAIIFMSFFRPVYQTFLFVPSAVVISFLFSLMLPLALDLMARYNSETVRKSLAEFISVLNRWCSVKEDIFYAFEKSVNSGIGEPLKTFVRDMVIQVNRGIDPLEAMNMLQIKVDNVQFRDFIVNIKQNIRHRGDIIKLLTNLENQFYKIEEEYNRRKISTYKDRMLIYFVMFAVLLMAYFFIKNNAKIQHFYIYTTRGKLLLTFFSLLYSIGIYLSFGITKFKH